ncbi:sugar phosphate isomerase/epimerase family protein [Paenibacillus tarimensis]
MKFGIADYGLNVWDGGCFDYEERWLQLKKIGYEGVERLTVANAEDAMHKAARMRKLGMDFTTVRGPSGELSIQWTSALGKSYVWTEVSGKDFNTFCRQVNIQAEACERWGIHAALHNHMGTLVETQEDLEAFLNHCPKCNLVLDTAHLAAAGGNPTEIVKKYPERLQVVHLKDWLLLDPNKEQWHQRGRFCELGAGNIGLDNVAVMKALVEVGYDGWVFIEHDTHLQDPLKDLSISREFLRNIGF